MFIQITKVDAAKRLVYGTITEETPDKSGEIFDYKTGKPAVQKWSDSIKAASDGKSLGNVRAMHGSTAAGKFTEINYDDENKRIEAVAKVVDDAEWNKVVEGVYTGFSIGGGYAARWADPTNPALKRYTPNLSEVSLVDNPCVPTATFEYIKADGSQEMRKFNLSHNEDIDMKTAAQNSGGEAAKHVVTSDQLIKFCEGGYVPEMLTKSLDDLDVSGLSVGEVKSLEAELAKRADESSASGSATLNAMLTQEELQKREDVRIQARKEGAQVWKSSISGKIFDTKDEMTADNVIELAKATAAPAQKVLDEINAALTKKEGKEEEETDAEKAAKKKKADDKKKEEDDAAAKAKKDEKEDDDDKAEKAAEASNLLKTYAALAMIVPQEHHSDPAYLLAELGKAATAEALMKKDYGDKARKEMADKGEAMPDGSFPIKTKKDLENAVQAFGRAKDKDKAKAHIKARAKAMGAEDMLPDAWSGAKEKSEKMAKNLFTVAELAHKLQWLANIQESTVEERAREGDDSKVPEMIMVAVKQLGDSLKAMVVEEVDELFDGDDDAIPAVMIVECAAKNAEGVTALGKFIKDNFTPELMKADAADDAVVRMDKFADELTKAGAKHSKADMEKYAAMHKMVADHADACAQMGKDFHGEMTKCMKDAGMLPTQDSGASSGSGAAGSADPKAEKLFKGLLDAEKLKNEALEKQMGGMTEQLQALFKRISNIEAQPAPGKGVLKSIGKSTDNGGTGDGKATAEDQLKTDLAKMSTTERNQLMMKVALANPILDVA